MSRKIELLREVAEIEKIPLERVTRAVDCFFERIIHHNMMGLTVHFRGFGAFKVVRREKKIAQDICRGKNVVVPAHFGVKFVACKSYKNNVKKGGVRKDE